MEYIISLAGLSLCLSLILIFCVKKNIKLQKEIKKEKQNDKIDQETVEKIESINTGNNASDFNNSINIMHELAEKK